MPSSRRASPSCSRRTNLASRGCSACNRTPSRSNAWVTSTSAGRRSPWPWRATAAPTTLLHTLQRRPPRCPRPGHPAGAERAPLHSRPLCPRRSAGPGSLTPASACGDWGSKVPPASASCARSASCPSWSTTRRPGVPTTASTCWPPTAAVSTRCSPVRWSSRARASAATAPRSPASKLPASPCGAASAHSGSKRSTPQHRGLHHGHQGQEHDHCALRPPPGPALGHHAAAGRNIGRPPWDPGPRRRPTRLLDH